MKHRPLYIFDLDGTLADCLHRKHYLDDVEDPTRWRKFYAACHLDRPIAAVIDVLERLRVTGAEIWIFSGRSDEVRAQTVDWLTKHTSFMSWDLETQLVMRRAGDHRGDEELKYEMLTSMLKEDRDRLVAIFDDRDRVVKMWREAGVPCFQVAPGDF